MDNQNFENGAGNQAMQFGAVQQQAVVQTGAPQQAGNDNQMGNPNGLLQFGNSTIGAFGFNPEIKEHLKMDKGNVTITAVEIDEKLNQETGRHYKALSIQVKSIEDDKAGAYDSISGRTPSKFILGLERIKYLFNAVGKTLPNVQWMYYAQNGSQDQLSSNVTQVLMDHQANGGNVAQLVSLNAQGVMIFNSLAAFNQVFGDDSPISYIFADLAAVGKKRSDHNRKMNRAETPIQQQALKMEYHAWLDQQPVIPSAVNSEALELLKAELTGIKDSASPFYIETKRKNQIKNYEAIKTEF